jgi:hypothetical protein
MPPLLAQYVRRKRTLTVLPFLKVMSLTWDEGVQAFQNI